MGKRQEQELDAIRLYAEGNEIPAIADELGVSENSLRKWKKRAGTDWQDARRVARKSQLVDMETVGSRLRRSREIAAQMAGSAKDHGEVGLIINQGLQTMIYDAMERLDTINVDPDALGKLSKTIGNLTLALGRTEQAASINLKREKEIRKQALEDAAKTVETSAKAAGVSAEAIQEIRRDVLRMAA